MGTRLSRMLKIMKTLETADNSTAISDVEAKVDIVDALVDDLTTNLAGLEDKVDIVDTVVDTISTNNPGS